MKHKVKKKELLQANERLLRDIYILLSPKSTEHDKQLVTLFYKTMEAKENSYWYGSPKN